MGANAPFEFQFLDESTNQTFELQGHLEPVDIPVWDIPKQFNATTVATHTQRFDATPTGPMLYVLAVIFVYGLSMFLIVGTLARKKSYHKQLDVEVARYIKGLEAAREETKRQQVNLTRLRWPGNFVAFKSNDESDSSSTESEDVIVPVHQRHRRGSLSQSDECMVLPATTVRFIDEVDDDDDVSSGSNCVILPATTVIVVDEGTDMSGHSQLSLIKSEPDQNKLTVPTFYLPKVDNTQKEVRFLETQNYGSSDLNMSNFSLREATCLSTEDLSIVQNTHNSTPNNITKIQSVSHQDIPNTVHKNNTVSISHQDIPNTVHKKKHSFFGRKISRSHSTNETHRPKVVTGRDNKLHVLPFKSDSIDDSPRDSIDDQIAYPSDGQLASPANKRRKTRSSKSKHSHNSPALKRNQTGHKYDKHRSSPKTVESGDSGDGVMLEEYRKSQLYKMRSRGRRSQLTVDEKHLSGGSSNEGSPLIPVPFTRNRTTPVIGTPKQDSVLALTDKQKWILNQMSHQPVHSDASDVEDPVLEKYMHSGAYQSRTRGRRTALY